MKKTSLLPKDADSRSYPHYLQLLALGLLTIVLVLSFLVSDTRLILLRSSDWLLSAVLPAVVIEKTNEARAEASALPLRRSTLLDDAAKLKAEHMAKGEYFAHYSPGGVSPWFWFEEVGYVYAHAGENLAVHFTDSKKVVDAWMDSPTHRANIEDSNYLEIGVGTAKGQLEGYDTVFVVQLFGTPAAVTQVNNHSVKEEVRVIAKEDIEAKLTATDTAVLGEAIDIVPVLTPEPVAVLQIESTSPGTGTEEETLAQEEIAVGSDLFVAETFLATTSSLLPIQTSEFEEIMKDHLTTPPSFTLIEPSSNVVSFIYTFLVFVITLLLLLSVLLSVRHHRPWQIIYSVLTFILLLGVTSVSELEFWIDLSFV